MTNCLQCKAMGLDHDEIEARCRGSLYWFCYYMVSDWVSQNLHLPIAWRLQEWTKGHDTGSYLLMIPRGHLKTTLIMAYALWRLISDPSLRVLLVMSSQRLAREKVGKMQSVVLSKTFRHWFGYLVPDIADVRWNKSELELVRPIHHEEPSVTGLGAESKTTGGHYDIQILDDLIDLDAENSEIYQDNAIRFLAASAGLWVRRDSALRIVVGTYWPGKFYDKLIKSESYKKIVLGARVDDRYRAFMADCGLVSSLADNSPIFPEMETEATLQAALEDFGPAMFAAQMLNLPCAPGDVTFKEEDIRFFSWADERRKAVGIDDVWYPTQTLYRQLTVDPAGGRSLKADKSAIVVSGYARGSSVAFILDCWTGNVQTAELIDRIINMALEHKVHIIRPEYVALQSMLGDYLRDSMVRRGAYIPISPVRPGPVSKGLRIVKSLQPWVSSGQVYFRRDQKELPDELLNLVIDAHGQVKGTSPNLVDALSYHTEFWRRTPKQDLPDDDIPFEDDDEPTRPIRARYGLQCESRQAWLTS